MCVLHTLFIACFCACFMTHAVNSDDVDHEAKQDPYRVDRINSTGSRDQHVKDVKHVGKNDQHGKSNTTFMEGLHYVGMIFKKFGNNTFISAENFEKLFHELEYGHSANSHHDDHDESEYSHDHDEHSVHNHTDHSAHDHDHSTHDHDHSTHDHDHSTYDHDHSAHDHDHSTHDHDHSTHDHDHSTHDHDHSTHDHDHSTHDHDHSTHDHDHSTHDHDHSTHDHDHSTHDHDHSAHDHEDHSEHDEHDDHSNPDKNKTGCSNKTEQVHNDMKTPNKTVIEGEKDEEIEKNRHKRTTEIHQDHSDCLNAKDVLELFNLNNTNLNFEQFLYTCPALLYQQINPKCKKYVSKSHISESLLRSIPGEVWGYSTLAVVIISLVGLLGVAVIPIMQKVFYNHLLQFLVALAVGALTGDALLHLLPHALVGEDLHSGRDHGNHGNHQGAVLKGLCGLSGLFFFFVMERTLTIFTKIKRERKQSKRNTLSPKDITACKDDGNHKAKKLSAYDESDHQSCEEMVMVVHPNKSIKGYADETHDKIFHTSHDGCRPKEPKHSHANPQTAEEEGMLSLPHSHSGHSHHAHCEMLTTSVASVAWMVILGDGIHNFSDGLAIGAAFSSSITGGVSTSIAVFCHELPHEIGDFAVLLRAGMSIKQAIVYNILSSIMCFMGMLIGVAIGNIDEASSWIFAAVAGMFIYIATVDMLPEMTSVETKRGEHPFCHLFLQCMGMIAGAGIMLLIAFFEEDLLTALDG